MTKTILAAVLMLGTVGAALAEGEGFATTGDWREIPAHPASASLGWFSQSQAPATATTNSTKPDVVVVR